MDHLSNAGQLFVTDAAVGSCKGLRIRTVVEDGASGLFLKNVLSKTRPAADLDDDQDIKLFCAPSFPTDKPFVLVDVNAEAGRASVVFAGVQMGPAVLRSLALVASELLAVRSETAVPLACDTLVGADGSVSLAFGMPDDFAAASFRGGGLYGAHAALWDSASGVSRLWEGAMLPANSVAAKLGRGDVVLADGTAAARSAGDNQVSQPKELLFADSGAPRDLNTAEAVQRLSSFVLCADAASRIEALLQGSGGLKARTVNPAAGAGSSSSSSSSGGGGAASAAGGGKKQHAAPAQKGGAPKKKGGAAGGKQQRKK